MKNLALLLPMLLVGSVALSSCHPSRDATKANEAVARGGGQPADLAPVAVGQGPGPSAKRLPAGRAVPVNRR